MNTCEHQYKLRAAVMAAVTIATLLPQMLPEHLSHFGTLAGLAASWLWIWGE